MWAKGSGFRVNSGFGSQNDGFRIMDSEIRGWGSD
jgi:hypothetical protein